MATPIKETCPKTGVAVIYNLFLLAYAAWIRHPVLPRYLFGGAAVVPVIRAPPLELGDPGRGEEHPCQGEEPDRGPGLLIEQDFGVGQACVGIDRRMQVRVADPDAALGGSCCFGAADVGPPTPAIGNASEASSHPGAPPARPVPCGCAAGLGAAAYLPGPGRAVGRSRVGAATGPWCAGGDGCAELTTSDPGAALQLRWVMWELPSCGEGARSPHLRTPLVTRTSCPTTTRTNTACVRSRIRFGATYGTAARIGDSLT